LTLHRRVPEVVDQLVTGDLRNHRPLTKLTKIVTDVVQDRELRHAVEELGWRCLVFDRLREAMRIAPVGGGKA
jgi:hypothetical protein